MAYVSLSGRVSPTAPPAQALQQAQAAAAASQQLPRSYDAAVEMGLAGEWVAGLMRDPGDAAEAGDDALQLFFSGGAAPVDAVLDGGGSASEDEGGADQPHPAAGGSPHARAQPAAKRARLGSRGAAGEGEGSRALVVVSEGGGPLRPELMRMSGYRPRMGLLMLEVEDDSFTLNAIVDFLGS